jgi:hypothetical protein
VTVDGVIPNPGCVFEDLSAGGDHEVGELGCFIWGSFDGTAQLFEIAAVAAVVVELEGLGSQLRLEIADRVREFR